MVDQNQMIEEFAVDCHADDPEDRGLLHSSNLWKLGEKYGFTVQECNTQNYPVLPDASLLDVFQQIRSKQTVLIGTKKWIEDNGKITEKAHCLRFFRLDGNTRIFALEPSKGIERSFTFDELRIFEPWLYILTLKNLTRCLMI